MGAGVGEEQPLLEEPAKGYGRHTCRPFPFPTCQLLACVSPWLNRARSRYQRTLGNTAFGQFQERERESRRVRNDSKQAKDWPRMLSLSLYHFVSLINEHLEGREPIHLYVTRVHHMFSDGGRVFTVLPVEDFIFSPTAEWLAVPPCGRNVSPSSINIRFHHVNLLWTTNVGIPSASGSFECLCVAGPPRLDLRVAWHGQSCSWLATGT